MPSTAKPLTLIVATTASLGIGRNGTLPWPSLKQEMAYFAHVTKRPPPHTQNANMVNAVIMGRKTWDSIPQKFRPLKGRVNIVVSRTLRGEGADDDKQGKGEEKDGPVFTGSLDEAVDMLGSGKTGSGTEDVGDVFVIGGSSIYDAALEHPHTTRVLVTKILKPEYECDTYFPLDLDGREAKEQGWLRKSDDELQEFVGVKALETKDGEKRTRRRQGEIEWEYCMYQREKNSR